MTAIRTALVIGGGIAGPVTALALRRAGIAATIYEAYETSAEGMGGTLMLAPNGLAALNVVGADVSKLGDPIQRMVMADGKGKRFGEFPGIEGLPASRVMWRADLYRALHDRARAAGIPIEYGKRLDSVDETAPGISARFTDGTLASADVLIGADGIRSKVRTLIDPGAPGPEYTGLLGLGGLARDVDLGGPTDAMHFVFGEKAFLGYWSKPGGGTLWFCNLPHETPMSMAEARAIPNDEWHRRVTEVYRGETPGSQLVAGTDPDGMMVFGGGEILPSVPHWHRGRMVLVGDAALAPSSSSGQGASLAAESAVQLARCLRDLPDVTSAFAAYEDLRRYRVEKIAADAAKTNNRKAAGPITKALMSLLMPLAMKTFLKPEKMFGWTHRYRIEWDETVIA